MDFPHLNVIGRPENLKISEISHGISKKVNRQSISHDFISNKAVSITTYSLMEMENPIKYG